MSKITEQLDANVNRYYSDPSMVLGGALDAVEAALDGEIDLVDPTGPFPMLVEVSASMVSTAMIQGEGLTRKTYPHMSSNFSELYHHMSDVDTLERFSLPSATTFTLAIQVPVLKNGAVLDPVNGSRRVTIPGDSIFSVAGTPWSNLQDIDIIMSKNGSIQVTYDYTRTTGLLDSGTNLLKAWVTTTGGVPTLVVEVYVKQVLLTSITEPVSSSTGLSTVHGLTDQYYTSKVYHQKNNGPWEEVATTHSDQLRDPTRVTVEVTVLEGSVRYRLPSIYVANGLAGDNFRIDTYESRGVLVVDHSDYLPADFSAVWRDLDSANRPEVIAMSTLTDMVIFSTSVTSGGRAELTFDELRDRVVYRSGDTKASITFNELRYRLSDAGFKTIKAKDTFTDRLYLCSRHIDPPALSNIATPIGVRHGKVEVDRQGVAYPEGVVIPHGTRTTITTKAIYRETNGSTRLLTEVEMNELTSFTPEELTTRLNESAYTYSPYHYVLDEADGMHVTRVYDLDTQRYLSNSWVSSNDSIGYRVQTTDVSISRVEGAYHLTVTASGPEDVKGFAAQIMYEDENGHRYHMTGRESDRDGGYFSVVFVMETALDVSFYRGLGFLNFLGIQGGTEKMFLQLDTMFNLYYIHTGDSEPTVPDELVNSGAVTYALPYPTTVTHETITVQLGKELVGMSSRSKAILIPGLTLHYPEDVPARYTTDVLERDETDTLVWSINPDTGKPEFNTLFKAGEVRLGNDNTPMIEHRKGDVVTGRDGKVVMSTEERLTWEYTPMLLDAAYWFATAPEPTQYRESIPGTVEGYLSFIRGLKPSLIEGTVLVFQPLSSIGKAEAVVDGNVAIVLNTALVFNVTYMLTVDGMASNDIQEAIHAAARTVILNHAKGDTYSTGVLTRQLMDAGGLHALDVVVDSPIQGFSNAYLTEPEASFSVKTNSVVLSNQSIGVEEAISINFYVESTT